MRCERRPTTPPRSHCAAHPPLLQTRASNPPCLYKRRDAHRLAGAVLTLSAHWAVCESVWYSVICLCGYHSHSRHFLYPFLTNMLMAGQRQGIIRNSVATWRPMIPCLITVICEIRMCSLFFFFFKACYCDCTLVLTSRVQVLSPCCQSYHSEANNAALNKSQTSLPLYELLERTCLDNCSPSIKGFFFSF